MLIHVHLSTNSPKRTLGLLHVYSWAEDWLQDLGGVNFTATRLPVPEATVTLDLGRVSVPLDRVKTYIEGWNRSVPWVTATVTS